MKTFSRTEASPNSLQGECPPGCLTDHDEMWAHSLPVEAKPWGEVSKFTVRADGHDVEFDADESFAAYLWEKDPERPGRARPGPFSHAEGGYVLIRFDIAGSPMSVVHVEPQAGSGVIQGRAPVDLMDRAIGYLTVLRDKLRAFDALETGEVR